MNKFSDSVFELNENADTNPTMYGAWYEFDCSGYRSDSRVISFSTLLNDSKDDSYLRTYYNLNTEDGREISFDDVVKDRDAIVKYVEDQCPRLSPDNLENLISNISNGTADFIIHTNGVEFRYTQSTGYGYASAFVSAFSCPDAFDTHYFDSIPADNYTVMGDDLQRIAWDIDDDGFIDYIAFNIEYNDNGLEMVIDYNDNRYTLNEKVLHLSGDDLNDILYGQNDICKSKLMVDDFGKYLYVLVPGAKEYHAFTFKLLDDEKIMFSDSMACYEVVRDSSADDFVFGFEKYPIGNVVCYQEYSINSNGEFSPQKENYFCMANFITLKDLKVTTFDDLGNEAGKMTMPAGSIVALTEYNEEKNVVYLEIKTSQGTTDKRVRLDMSTIEDVDETFTYVFHGE